jgi:hypothetical protein
MRIVALRGYDGYGRGYGDATADPITPLTQQPPTFNPATITQASSASSTPGLDPVIVLPPGATVPSPPMTPATKLIWILSLSAIGYIFWATLQPKSRRLLT